MKRKDFFKLYTVDHVPGANGRMKRIHRYVGKMYAVDEAARKEAVRSSWPALLGATAAFVGGGFIPASAQMCIYVLPFFAFCLVALYYLYTSVIVITRMKGKADEMQVNDGLQNGPKAGIALMILSAGWLLTSLVYFVVGHPTSPWWAEGLFAACGALSGVCGYVLYKAIGSIKATELPKEKDIPAENQENEEIIDAD